MGSETGMVLLYNCSCMSLMKLAMCLLASRHTVVCRAAKKASGHTVSIFTGEYIYRKKENSFFTHA